MFFCVLLCSFVFFCVLLCSFVFFCVLYCSFVFFCVLLMVCFDAAKIINNNVNKVKK